MVDQMMWVPEPVHRRTVGVLRGWVIALAAVVLVGVLTLGALLFRWVFAVPPFPVVVSSPAECRLGGDPQSPKLYVTVDVRMIAGGSLATVSSLGPRGWDVEAAGVVPSVPSLDSLDDAELTHIVESADEDPLGLGVEQPSGVLLVKLDTRGESSGSLAGLRTEWVEGEPAQQQDLPLGVEFTPTGCTVTTAR